MASKNKLILNPEGIDWDPIEELPTGAWIKTLRVDEETGASANLVKFEKGFREPMHKHPSSHDIVVLDGKLVDVEDGKEIQEGMYLFSAAGEEHAVEAVEESLLFVYFDGPAF